jgi:hypothetical protein
VCVRKTTLAEDTLARQIATDAIHNGQLKRVTSDQLKEINVALGLRRAPKMQDVTPPFEENIHYNEMRVGDDVFVAMTDSPDAKRTWFYADSISNPERPAVGRGRSSKAEVIDSWRQLWRNMGPGGYQFDAQQVANSAAPKNSACAHWLVDDSRQNSKGNPDYWDGLYKNAAGNFLVEDDNSEVKIFDAKGRYVDEGNTQKMSGFLEGLPTR